MTENFGFPKDILLKNGADKIEYFQRYTVAHHNLKKSSEKLFDVLKNPGNTNIILVYGPSGVGKTTLFLKTAKSIIESCLEEMSNDPGLIPIAGVEAVAPDNGNFDWKDHYIRSLASLDEPLIFNKVDFNSKRSRNQSETKEVNRALRRSLENALKNRKSTAYMIDEAQHLTKIASGRKLRNQMDTIKSIASYSNVPHVLFGTYELLPFRNLSGQLSRRGSDIHLCRYRTEKDGDIDHFINALWAFQKHLPLEKEPQLVDDYDFFYQRSIGCIGILKEWLMKSYKAMVDNNENSLSMDMCTSFALTIDQCVHMIREAREGEQLLEENAEKEEELLRLLGVELLEDKEEDEHKTSKKKQVGKRNPTRDLVGDVKHVQ